MKLFVVGYLILLCCAHVSCDALGLTPAKDAALPVIRQLLEDSVITQSQFDALAGALGGSGSSAVTLLGTALGSVLSALGITRLWRGSTLARKGNVTAKSLGPGPR